MWRLPITIALLLFTVIMALAVTPVFADTSVDITVTASPMVSGGIENFVITYISETQLDFSWGYTGDATHIMIRGKYGEYPENISDPDTDPSDGYLVYYGTGTSASDTTMDFDESPGAIYYVAWAQKDDGTWYMDMHTGWEESAILTLIGFIILCGILSFLSVRTTYYILKFLAGCSWIVFAMYWIASPPSVIDDGSPVDTAMIVFLFVCGVAIWFMPFWYTKKSPSGEETGGKLRMPFMKTEEEEEEAKRRSKSLSGYHERADDYRRRIADAGIGIRRRRFGK